MPPGKQTDFGEWREWTAKHLVEEAMAAGLIDLEDVEFILAGKRPGAGDRESR
jgi:hypothetical protein